MFDVEMDLVLPRITSSTSSSRDFPDLLVALVTPRYGVNSAAAKAKTWATQIVTIVKAPSPITT